MKDKITPVDDKKISEESGAVPFYNDAVSAIDAGLRKYMLGVFSRMSVGLALTAITAYIVSTSPSLMSGLYGSGLFWVILFAPFAMVIYLSARISSMSSQTAQRWFYAYSAVNGASLAPMFLVYSGTSIALAFFSTSAMFLSMVIYGYSTDKDLTSVGSFCFMGLLGIIIASLVNLFTKSSTASLVISLIGVVIFTGLTAWDSQVIKSYYFEGEEQESQDKKSILGALTLYLDFINLFLYILRFVGAKRE